MHDYLVITLVICAYFSPVIYQAFLLIKEENKTRRIVLKKFLQILKISIMAFILILSVILTLNHTNYLNYSKPIPFENYDQITFKDFKGLEFFHKKFQGSQQFAYIVTTINHLTEKDSININARFHPSRSFVYDRDSRNGDLLTHELYHFKITEIYARNVRMELSKIDTISRKRLEEIIDKFWNKERQFQKKYDYDTYHSYVYGEQKKYEREIDSLLSLLSKFENPKIKLNVKK